MFKISPPNKMGIHISGGSGIRIGSCRVSDSNDHGISLTTDVTVAPDDDAEIRAFIADKTPIEVVAAASDEIAKFPEVLRVDAVTQEQALERAKSELGEFKDVFEFEFLPASLDVKLKPGFRDPATVRRIATRLRDYEFVDDVRYGDEWITAAIFVLMVAGWVFGSKLNLNTTSVAFMGFGVLLLANVITLDDIAKQGDTLATFLWLAVLSWEDLSNGLPICLRSATIPLPSFSPPMKR